MIFTLPNPADVLAALTDWMSPFFDEMLPLELFAVGVFVGTSLLIFLVTVIQAAFFAFSYHKNDPYEGASKKEIFWHKMQYPF